jgi:hypothetical protein
MEFLLLPAYGLLRQLVYGLLRSQYSPRILFTPVVALTILYQYLPVLLATRSYYLPVQSGLPSLHRFKARY